MSLPLGLPSFASRNTGCRDGFCRLLGLALPEWLETALLCPQDPRGQSALHGCVASPQPRLENGSPARQTCFSLVFQSCKSRFHSDASWLRPLSGAELSGPRVLSGSSSHSLHVRPGHHLGS